MTDTTSGEIPTVNPEADMGTGAHKDTVIEASTVDPEQWEKAMHAANVSLRQAGEADWASWKCGGGPHQA